LQILPFFLLFNLFLPFIYSYLLYNEENGKLIQSQTDYLFVRDSYRNENPNEEIRIDSEL